MTNPFAKRPLALTVASLLALTSPAYSLSQTPIVQPYNPVYQVAIIGAGAAGSTTASFLQKLAQEAGVTANVTIFEKTDRIGGRTLTVNPYDDPSQRLELGASIFIEKNKILHDALKEYGLKPRDPDADADPTLGIWDGDDFVFTINQSDSFWWNAGKAILRYGFFAPRRTQQLMENTIGKFLKLYEAPHFPFRSLTTSAYELDLVGTTGVTGEQLLKDNKIGDLYAHDIIQASTRVNYASNLAFIHGLDTMVSMAPEGAMAVEGGNWQIFHKMVQKSGAYISLNTTITSIDRAEGSDEIFEWPRYTLKTSSSGKSDSETTYPTDFDHVVIATPYQFSNIITGDGVMEQVIDKIPYVSLHVTLLASPFQYSAKFFGKEEGAAIPATILTTLAKDDGPASGAQGAGKAGFFSISTLRKGVNPKTKKEEYLYKIFSPEKVTPEFLSRLFGIPVPDTFVDKGAPSEQPSPIAWFYPHVFHSYPKALPRVTFQDPIIGDRLYYTSGMESFISTMETNALMGKNVAHLIVDDILHQRLSSPYVAIQGEIHPGPIKIECDRGRRGGEVPKTRPTEVVMQDL